jgi:hypothetical protein
VEVAGEGRFDPFAYPERSVRLDVDGNVGREEREAVGSRAAWERERGCRAQNYTAADEP